MTSVVLSAVVCSTPRKAHDETYITGCIRHALVVHGPVFQAMLSPSKHRPETSGLPSLRRPDSRGLSGGQWWPVFSGRMEVTAGHSQLAVFGGFDDQRGVVACGQYLLDTPPRRRRDGIRHAIIPISGCTGLVEVVGEAC